MCIVLFVHSLTYGVNKWTFLLFLTLLGFNLFCLAGLSTSFDVMLLILVLFVYRSGHFLFDFSRFFFSTRVCSSIRYGSGKDHCLSWGWEVYVLHQHELWFLWGCHEGQWFAARRCRGCVGRLSQSSEPGRLFASGPLLQAQEVALFLVRGRLRDPVWPGPPRASGSSGGTPLLARARLQPGFHLPVYASLSPMLLVPFFFLLLIYYYISLLYSGCY